MWWQLFCKKEALKQGQTCPWNALCFRNCEKYESSNVIHCRENPIEWHGCSASSVLSRLGSIPFFGNLGWHWREGGLVTSAQFKNSLLLYAVQRAEKMVDTFIRDRALKECPLCRSQSGCWSATLIETSVYDVIYVHLECIWTWWPYKECSLIMWKHLKYSFNCRNTWSWIHC